VTALGLGIAVGLLPAWVGKTPPAAAETKPPPVPEAVAQAGPPAVPVPPAVEPAAPQPNEPAPPPVKEDAGKPAEEPRAPDVPPARPEPPALQLVPNVPEDPPRAPPTQPRSPPGKIAVAKPRAKPVPGRWFSLLRDTPELIDAEGAKFQNGVLEFTSRGAGAPSVQARDATIRARVFCPEKTQNVLLGLRGSHAGGYSAWINYDGYPGIGKGIGSGQNFRWVDLATAKAQVNTRGYVLVSFEAVGDRLTLYVGTTPVVQARDKMFSAGHPSVSATNGRGFFKDLEFLVKK
jgi:hypothetical protein